MTRRRLAAVLERLRPHRRPTLVVIDLREVDPAFERALATLAEPLPIPEQRRGEWR